MSLDSFDKLLYIIISLAAFFVGATLASGINCLVYRLTIGASWVHGRSHCEYCGHMLSWWELIPVFGCLILRARCTACGHYFGYRHAVSEIACGVCFCAVGGLVATDHLQLPGAVLFCILCLCGVAVSAATANVVDEKKRDV